MADEEKKVEEKAPEEESEQGKKKEKSGMMMMIIISVGVFVIGIAGFSLMMGVFSSPEKTEDEGDKTAEVTKKHDKKPADKDKHGKESAEDQDFLEDIARLEDELFGVHDVGDANDMDDIMSLVDEEGDEDSGMSEKDSLEAVNWLDTEKAALAKERKELDVRKKELDKQEYRLKQLIAKTDQIKSSRLGSLAKLYDGMKPSQVAPLIIKLSEQQAVDILLKMKPGNAAKILGAIKPDRAARISARMITLTEE
ncbi:MAG: hypothetical protein KAR42_08695 [candidate division Zixibacteria bacterium]|nr:hypothetical protein [candidate division Zixibacteria bacterium]